MIKPNLAKAYAQSVNVEDTAVTMELIVESEGRSTSLTQVTRGSVVETSVAGLDKTEAEKLKDQIEAKDFLTTLNQNIEKDQKIKDFQVTEIATPEIDVEPGELIDLQI